MNEKMFKTTLNFLKAHKDEVKESYGSLIIRKIKGGITYKIYFKLVDYEKWDNKPAYMKLESPRKPLRAGIHIYDTLARKDIDFERKKYGGPYSDRIAKKGCDL